MQVSRLVRVSWFCRSMLALLGLFLSSIVPQPVLSNPDDTVQRSEAPPSLEVQSRASDRDASRGRIISTGLTPYTGDFGAAEAAHLVGRALVGPTWEEVEWAADAGLEATLDRLLGGEPAPAQPAWAGEPHPDMRDWTREMRDSLHVLYRQRGYLLQVWWADAIVHTRTNLTERMTLFWHDHFATALSTVWIPQAMYVQNETLRRHALGNFRDLVRAIARDPAMLIWLDGRRNRVGEINENFARELLELFTLGLDQYTQDDVVAAARAFTGWVTHDGLTSRLVPARHDDGMKTFLGRTGPWDGDDVIDIIFEQDETARFLCRKLYREFVDEFPDEAVVEELAATLRNNDYEIRPVLRRLLGSEHIFDEEFRGALFKDGVDMTAGLLRTFHMGHLDMSHNRTPAGRWVLFGQENYGQLLFEPPNVAGWPGYRAWIDTYTLPWRKTLSVALVNGEAFGTVSDMKIDAMDFVSRLPDADDPEQLIDDLATLLFGMAPSELVRQRMLEELLQGAEPWEWHTGLENAEARVQALLRLAMRLPDFQHK